MQALKYDLKINYKDKIESGKKTTKTEGASMQKFKYSNEYWLNGAKLTVQYLKYFNV